MADNEVIPELKQILGALVFGSGRPVALAEMRHSLVEVAAEQGGITADFGKARDGDIRAALAELDADLRARKVGFHLAETAAGYRLQSDGACGVWLRHLLKVGRPNRLSRPALETLAIIAYRQPITRAEIEGVRGVNVDHIVRSLLEMQLIRLTGRSELPGRPLLYGITQLFLDHFGLKDVKELPGIEQLCRMESELSAKQAPGAEPVTESEQEAAEGADEESDEESDEEPDEEDESDEEDEDDEDEPEDDDGEPQGPD